MNRYINYLVEENKSLFTFDINEYEPDQAEEIVNSLKDVLMPKMSEVLTSVYGFSSVPKNWKEEKDPDTKFYNLYYEQETGKPGPVAKLNYLSELAKRVISELVTKFQFRKYEASWEPYAFINNTPLYIDRIKLRHLQKNSYLTAVENNFNEFKENFKNFPEVVQNLFKKSPTYKVIWVSPDNGTLITYENGYDTTYNQTNMSTKTKITLKLTGEVLYDTSEKVGNKDVRQNEKQDFFDFYLTKRRDESGKSTSSQEIKKYICKYFLIDENNEPCYISFFNMEDMVNLAQANLRINNVPTILAILVKNGKYKTLSSLEKDDKNAAYEFVNNGIHIYIYSYIPEKYKQYINDNTIVPPFYHNPKNEHEPNYLVMVKLDSFALDMYHDIFG